MEYVNLEEKIRDKDKDMNIRIRIRIGNREIAWNKELIEQICEFRGKKERKIRIRIWI